MSFRPRIVKAKCTIVRERNPDAVERRECAFDKFSRTHGEVVTCFKHLTSDNVHP